VNTWRNLTFTQEEVTSEINVVLEERRMRLDNNPFGIASERFLRAMHPLLTLKSDQWGLNSLH
jgi:predicted Zn-dependent peptidase